MSVSALVCAAATVAHVESGHDGPDGGRRRLLPPLMAHPQQGKPTLFQSLNDLAVIPQLPTAADIAAVDYYSRERRDAENALCAHPLYPEFATALQEYRTLVSPMLACAKGGVAGDMNEVEVNLSIWQQKLGQLDQGLKKEGIHPTDASTEVRVPVGQPFSANSDLCDGYKQKLAAIGAAYHRLVADHQKLQEVFMSHAVSMLRHHAAILPASERDLEKMIRVAHTRLMQPLAMVKEECLEAIATLRRQIMTDTVGRKKRTNFSKEALTLLNDFFIANINNPYPTEAVKEELAQKCGITVLQVSNWFGNKRIRFKKCVVGSKEDAQVKDEPEPGDSYVSHASNSSNHSNSSEAGNLAKSSTMKPAALADTESVHTADQRSDRSSDDHLSLSSTLVEREEHVSPDVTPEVSEEVHDHIGVQDHASEASGGEDTALCRSVNHPQCPTSTEPPDKRQRPSHSEAAASSSQQDDSDADDDTAQDNIRKPQKRTATKRRRKKTAAQRRRATQSTATPGARKKPRARK